MLRTNIKGKRLLILGAGYYQLPVIEKARELGCYVITLDYLPNNPGHRFADSFEIISTVDKEEVLEIALKYSIDGILTYGSDVSVTSVAYVAEQMRLPGTAYSSAQTIQQKDLFRTFLRDNDFPHPKFISLDHTDDIAAKIKTLTYPVVVKPVDSSGSKGQTVINCVDQAVDAYNHAKSFSRCGVVVFEEFLKSDITEIVGDIFVQGNKLAFRQYGHNYFLKDSPVSVPVGEIMPGVFNNDVTDQIDAQFSKLVNLMQIPSGAINFDGILSNGIFYIVDIGLRNGGNYLDDLIKLSSGFDITEATIYASFGIEYPCNNLFADNPKYVLSYILNASKKGKFIGIDVSDDISEYMTTSKLFVEIGSEVNPYLRGDWGLGIVFLSFPNKETFLNHFKDIENHISLRIGDNDQNDGDAKYRRFTELLSPYLKYKIKEAKNNNDTTTYNVLSRQFIRDNEEIVSLPSKNIKHYEATQKIVFENTPLRGIERLYKRSIVVEPILQCIAHCRYCLRKNYDPLILTENELHLIARYIGTAPSNESIREILVTGGDPFLIPERLSFFLLNIARYAPQIEIVRIASRLPLHQPDWISGKLLTLFIRDYPFRIEIGTQINHRIELFPEVIKAYRTLKQYVQTIYNQTVILKGINDSTTDLIELFDDIRDLGIENHYIFPCVPINGVDHLRVPLDRCLELANQLSTSGVLSGRAKPKLAVMTDIGKIILYENSIKEVVGNKYLLKSYYTFEDRTKYNTSWQIPTSAQIENDGMMSVWYEDVSKIK